MSGTINALGIGSGTLTADLIDKIKSAETTASTAIYNSHITSTTNKKNTLSQIMTGLASLKSSASTLGDEMLYLKRSTSSSDTSAVSISASSGVSVQDIDLKVSQLAARDIYQSNGVASSTTSLTSNTNSSISIQIGDEDAVSIKVDSGTSLEQLAILINDEMDGKVTASVVNTGTSTDPYRLVIKSIESGEENRLTISTSNFTTNIGVDTPTYTGTGAAPSADAVIASGSIKFRNNSGSWIEIEGVTTLENNSAKQNAQLFVDAINKKSSDTGVTASTSDTGVLTLTARDGSKVDMAITTDAATASGLTAEAHDTTTPLEVWAANSNKLSSAKNAKFTYNGIAMERSSNTVTDITTGLTLTLKDTTSSTVHLSVTQDTSSITSGVDDFVSAYNAIVSQLNDATKFDAENSKNSGVFLGVGEITSINSTLSSILNKTLENGSSLADYGLSFDSQTGMIEFDSTTLSTKLSSDPSALQKVFYGSNTVTEGRYTALRTATDASSTLAEGDLTINGIDIAALSLTGTTAEENAQQLAAAINKQTDKHNVTAYTNGNGKLIFVTKTGDNIQIKTTANGTSLSGLSSSATEAIAFTSTSTVASGKITTEEGIFAQLNEKLASMITGEESSLSLYNSSLEKNLDSDQKALARVLEQIESKYEIMAKQFAAYDAMINKYQQISSAITMQIDTMNAVANS